ncbi:hypothetical protein [Nocardiopsis ansamitocini]|uniref:Restriction system protein n=1 Tax=Nocardiopsis ansamitocini TaxID=1670832 RepID=A0A9W6UJE5_9ACTN|nr:hypothetical protein [Nocardiopsis ansamitocini]GLU47975.1 hypothetical protein Nans01_23260 [Nocardiopsis ansamitocini]
MAKGRGGNSDWQRQQQAAAQARQRQAAAQARQKQRKETDRKKAVDKKEKRRRYLEYRQAEVELKNHKIRMAVEGLEKILSSGVERSARVDLSTPPQQQESAPPALDDDLTTPVPTPQWEDFAPDAPGALSRIFGGGGRQAQRLAEAKTAYEKAAREASEQESARLRKVAAANRHHARAREDAEARSREHSAAVKRHIAGYELREKASVEFYLKKVLENVPLPGDFPREAEVVFTPGTARATVRFTIPPRTVVPDVFYHRYYPTKDEDHPVAREEQEIDTLYRSVVSQVALLCVRDLFDADPPLASVEFSGHVRTSATGYPKVIGLDVDRTAFPGDGELARADPSACAGALNAVIAAPR